ncbi:MAG: peroxiredoxin [Candidatus Odinarchaeota archaeon]
MLKIGDTVPPFTAPLDDGNTFNLDDYKGKNIIIYFYPRNNTPGCTKEACNIRDNYESLIEAGLTILGVSTDPVTSHQKFKNKYSLPFPLISDKEKQVVALFGVKSKIGTAKRVTFWIGADGTVKHVWDKVNTVAHSQEILDVFADSSA